MQNLHAHMCSSAQLHHSGKQELQKRPGNPLQDGQIIPGTGILPSNWRRQKESTMDGRGCQTGLAWCKVRRGFLVHLATKSLPCFLCSLLGGFVFQGWVQSPCSDTTYYTDKDSSTSLSKQTRNNGIPWENCMCKCRAFLALRMILQQTLDDE